MNSTAMNLMLADQDRASNFLNLLSLPHVERTFWRGMAVYALDDPAADVYVVLKGRVKIMRSSPEGARKTVSICYSGEIFGELALTRDEVEARRNDEAVALDTTRVAVIRVADFWGAARRDPSLVRDAMRHLTRRLAEAHSQIEALVFDHKHHPRAGPRPAQACGRGGAGRRIECAFDSRGVGGVDRLDSRSRHRNDDRISPA